MKITIKIDERPTQELPAIDPEVPEHKRAPDIAALEGMNERQYQQINALQEEIDRLSRERYSVPAITRALERFWNKSHDAITDTKEEFVNAIIKEIQ